MLGTENYNLLIRKLDQFIRKYYFNHLIKGMLFSIAFILVFFLLINFVEYRFFLSPVWRKVVFYSFIAMSLFILGKFVVTPLLKIQGLGSVISNEQAAQIIGLHFSSVQDKLLNILQLKNSHINPEQAQLIEASINQKALELKPIPFTQAVDLNQNKAYLKYALPPFLLLLFLLFFKPNIITESTQRIIQNNTVFEKPAPFQFVVNNKSLETIQFQDFKLDISLKGKEIPTEVYIVRKTQNGKNIQINTQKNSTTHFHYIFSNIQENTSFYLSANGFQSKPYTIKVNQKPMITNFSIYLEYPKYVNKSNETIKNNGDIVAPVGTKINWLFGANATKKLSMQFSEALFELEKDAKNQFSFHKTLKTNEKYIVKTVNNKVKENDSLQFEISAIFDEFPQISLKESQDSTNKDLYFYIGEVADDYGIKKLTFNYQILSKDNNKKQESVNIPFRKGKNSDFTYFWNIKDLNLKAEDKLTYYFEVWDNDGVNGSKATKSRTMRIEKASIYAMEKKSEQAIDQIKNTLEKSIEDTKEMQAKMKAFREKMLNKKDLDWKDKKDLEQMLKEQKKLHKSLEKLNQQFNENLKEQNEYKKINEDIAKKQEQVQKLFDQVLDEEMKALIEKYEKMLDKMNKENALEQAEEMQVQDEELEKELDRMLEMLKKLELEQKMQETQQKLEELAQKQEELANEKNKDQSKQEELNKEFEQMQESLEKLNQQQQELNQNNHLEELSENSEQTKQKMQEASQSIEKNQQQKATKKQKEVAQDLKKMAEQLSSMQMQMQAQSLEEDMQALRQLLENLVSLSFKEEELLTTFKKTHTNSPKYVQLVQKQHQLIENSRLVEDSLFALAKRVFQIEKFVTEKILDINRNLDLAVKNLEERIIYKAVANQQYAMTGYNDLALMLSEAMQQMQQQMAQQMQGNQTCQKPGQGKPKSGKMPSLKQMQQQLSDQISKMGEQMKKDGQGKAKPNGQQSKELAKMAAKQQAIREALQQIQQANQHQKEGKNLGDLQKIIDQMEQNETDIVNKRLSNELLERQQDILTRLLEAENAERQQDEKNERKAQIAQEKPKTIPPDLQKYLEKRKENIELYKTLYPNLKPYYKNISKKYFKNSMKI